MALPLIVALVPLLIAPGLLFFYDVTPKVALLLLGVAAALPWTAPGRLTARREGRRLLAVCAAAAGSLILSSVFSSRPDLSVFGTNWRRFGLITQLAALLFALAAAADMAGGGRLRAYLRASAAAAIPVSLYGVAQYFGLDPWLPKQAYHVGEGVWTIVRPPSTLGYVSYFAGYLVFAVFLGAALYTVEERGWWKRAGAAAAALGSVAIVLSGTRGAMLALLAGAVYLWFWFGRRIPRRVALLGAAGVVALGVFYYSPGGQMLRSRARWYAEDAWGGARLLLWRDSLALAGRHWLIGAGPETFSTGFPAVQSAALSRAYPDFYHESAHNILLDALTAQGAFGLVALMALIALALTQAQRAEGALGGLLGACFAAGLVANQFVVFTAPTALYFYLVTAMLVSQGKPVGAPNRLSPLVWAPLSIVLAVLAARLLAADYLLERLRLDLDSGSSPDAALQYQRVRAWGLTADIWYSRRMAEAARAAGDPVSQLRAWQQALEAGYRATKTAEDPHNAWYSLATLHARQDDFFQTEKCLRGAIQAAPRWFKPHWMLAQTLLAKGRRDEARGEARLAAELNGGRNPEVIRTLKRTLSEQ
ncbi:MAG TPA: O-antigen ligase family protein [Bryobacteraceae bacterium]|nr:O-antigen ligase family protein [Bryobacteraceae bacterium]